MQDEIVFETMYDIFVNTVSKYGDSIAIFHDDRTITYQELNDKVNGLAIQLNDFGYRNQDKVCVCLPRSIDLVISLLSVFKSGLIYVPFDPELPQERLFYMLGDCGATVLLTTKDLKNIFVNFSGRIIEVDTMNLIETRLSFIPTFTSLDSLSYIIYTSGSTGKPKGVCITHRALSNRFLWQQQEYILNREDKVLHKASISFDVSLWEILWSFMVGAQLVIVPMGLQRDINKIYDLIVTQNVTIVHFVPSALKLFLEKQNFLQKTNLRLIISSGEQLTYPICKLFFNQNKDNKILLKNFYGPTETTIDSTYFNVDSLSKTIPIGRPISNTQIYILDKNLRPLDKGKIGEIFIGGLGVANGYINNKKLTDKKFLLDPFKNNKCKMYKTGDLGVYLPDGNIKFIGRKDTQVKIMGFRVELSEIENYLLRHISVSEAVVLYKKVNNEQSLIAYYSTYKKSCIISYEEFKHFLSTFLPFYMIPFVFIKLDKLPLSSNYKIDRQALVNKKLFNIFNNHTVQEKFINYETELIKAWKILLCIDNINVNDNFFDIGGTSILLVKLRMMLKETLDKDIRIVDFFDHPTINMLSKFLTKN